MRTLIVLLGLLLSGCATVYEYPDDWPALGPVASGCPNISGTFVEIGVTNEYTRTLSTKNDYSNPSLSRELLRTDPLENRAIAIAQPDANSVIVSVIHSEDFVSLGTNHVNFDSHTFDLENGDFRCDEGKVWFPDSVGSTSWRNRIGFSKATDGSLVGEDHEVLVTLVGKLGTYYLWTAYTSD